MGLALPGPAWDCSNWSAVCLKPFVTPEFDGSTLAVNTLFLDRENTLWVGTLNRGCIAIHQRKVDSFRSVDGLSGDIIQALL